MYMLNTIKLDSVIELLYYIHSLAESYFEI